MTRKPALIAAAAVIALWASASFPAPLSAETFRFAYTKGEKYRILSTVKENVVVNGRIANRADILNKIAAEVTDTRGDAGFHSVVYNTSTRNYGSLGTYEWSEDYASEFWRDGRGIYTISDLYYMPVVRDVPAFPEGDVAVGQSWSASGSEAHDFRRNFGIQTVFSFPITVNYTYLRNEVRNGVDCAVISISYSVFYKVPAPARPTANYPRQSVPADVCLDVQSAGKRAPALCASAGQGQSAPGPKLRNVHQWAGSVLR
jgi:hypothetical protein